MRHSVAGAKHETYISDFKHVQIIPRPWLTLMDEIDRFVNNVHHTTMVTRELAEIPLLLNAWAARIRAIELVVDVSCNTERIRDGIRPLPGLVLAPVAHAVENLAAGSVEGIRHLVVSREGDVRVAVLALGVAVVVSRITDQHRVVAVGEVEEAYFK